MADLTAIIITFNEEIHIERCIRSLRSIASKIFIVDSNSCDRTVEIARSLGAEVVQRKWKNYADQFQWGLDHCGDNAEWVMRIDADEYLEQKLQHEIMTKLPNLPNDVYGIYLKRKHIFYGSWMRHGGRYPLVLLRIWRKGKGRIEQRWMDEHIVMEPGAKTIVMENDLVDANQKGITFWVTKHNSYASREMVELLNNRYSFLVKDEAIYESDNLQAKRRRFIKEKIYARLPLGLRALLYFVFRYIFQIGFLDGAKGFIYHFLQGFLYRLLVDIKLMEVEHKCGGDVEKMKQVLRKDYRIEVE